MLIPNMGTVIPYEGTVKRLNNTEGVPKASPGQGLVSDPFWAGYEVPETESVQVRQVPLPGSQLG